MQQAQAALDALAIRVVVITFEPPPAARAYRADTGVTWPILTDSGREVYRAYGMHRARLRHLIGPTSILAYTREVLRGGLPRWPQADPFQQGGDVLIDPSGIVRFHHVGAGSGHRPTVAAILARRRAPVPR